MKSRRKQSYLQVALYLLWFVLDSVNADSSTRTNTSASEWKKIFENDNLSDLRSWMQDHCPSDEVDARRGISTRDTCADTFADTFVPNRCTCTIPYYNFWCACNLIGDQNIDDILGTWNNSCNQAHIANMDTGWLGRTDKIPSWAYIGINDGTCNFAVIKEILDPKWTAAQILTPIIVFLVTVLFGTIFLAWRRHCLQRSHRKKKPSLLTSFSNLFKGRAPGVIHRIPNDTWVIDGPHGPADNDAASFISVPRTPLISSSVHEVSHWSASTSEIIPPRNIKSRIFSLRRFFIDHGMLGASTIRGLGKRVNNLWFGARTNNNARVAGDDSRRSSLIKSPSSIIKGGYSEIDDVERNVPSSIIVIGDTPEQSSDSNHQVRPPQRVGTVGDAANNPQSPSINVSLEPPSPSDEYVPVRFPLTIPESPGPPPLLPPAPQERPPPPPHTTPARQTSPPRISIPTQLDGPPLDLPRNTSNHVSDEYTNLSYVTFHRVSQNHSQTFLDARSTNESLSGSALDTEQRSGLRPLPPRPAESSGPAPGIPPLMHHKSDTLITVPNGAMTIIRGSSSIDDVQSVARQREFDPYTAPDIPISLQPNRPSKASSLRPYIHDHQRTASNTSLLRDPGDSFGYPQRGWSADDDISLLNHSPMEVDDAMDNSRGVYIAPLRDVETLPSRSARPGVISTESLPTFLSDVGVTENAGNSHGGTGGEFSPQSPTLSIYPADARLQHASYAGVQSCSEPSGWDDSTQSTHVSLPKPFALQPGPSLIRANRSREDALNHGSVRLFSGNELAAGRTTELDPHSVPVPVPSCSSTPRPPADATMVLGTSNRPLGGHESNSNVNDVRGVASNAVFSGYVSNRVKITSGGTWATDSSGVQSVYESKQQPPDVHKTSSQGPQQMP